MARVVRFLKRQLYFNVGAPGVADNTSEVFDVADAVNMQVEMRVYAMSGAGTITGQVQTTSDPGFTDAASWSTLAGNITLTTTGVTGTGYTGLQNFARVKLTVPAGVYATLGVNGVIRDQQ